MHGQTWTKAKRLFERVIAEAADEPELVDRAKLYLEACRQRLAEGAGEAEGEDPYLEAVVLKNAGHLDEALALCRRGGRHRKDERMAYLAASIHALRGEVAEAADLLGLAIELNPKNRG